MTDSALGIIAGKGAYPLELAVSARAQGVPRIVAIAFRGETDRAITRLADEVRWMYVGQLDPFLKAFPSMGVSRAVMAGQITPRNLFVVRVDAAMRALLHRLPHRNADTIFNALGEELRGVGVELLPANLFMERSMPAAGVLTPRTPDVREVADMRLGFEVAKTTSHLKIGQTVVVKEGTIIAVEAFEGTDAAIRRAGKVAGPGGVVIKVAQPGHDMRWDIPVIGARTMESLRKAGITALALEAGRAIILEREKVVSRAAHLKVAIQAWEPDDPAIGTANSLHPFPPS